MKPFPSLLVVAVAIVAGFLLGSRGGAASNGSAREAANMRTSASRPGGASGSSVADSKGTGGELRLRPGRQLTIEKAKQLNSRERIALLKKAALLSDPDRQEDVLCGLVSVMTREELEEAVVTLRTAMGRGNQWSQEVWDTVWKQWGKVDPQACLALAKKGVALFTPEDCRRFMMGWMEEDPAGAIRWASEPHKDPREAAAAAYAITHSAGGDLDKMQSAIASLSGDPRVVQSCLHDYFDLAISTDTGKTPAALYEQMPANLQAKAWQVVLNRTAYEDRSEAMTWLEQHASDPGAEYRWNRLFGDMSGKDPGGNMEWAMRLPTQSESGTAIPGEHPAVMMMNAWRSYDPAAADAWMQSRPAGDPWVDRLRPIPRK